MNGKKILVTGGCGYIGSHTAIDLLNHGYEVVSLDSLVRAEKSVEERVRKITGKNFRNKKIDLTDLAAVKSFFKQEGTFDGVIHFAAFKSVRESQTNPFLYYRNNLDALSNLLEAMQEAEIRNFIFSSSCTVYGNPDKVPVTELTPRGRPASAYGHTKIISEEIIEFISTISKIKTVMLRYFNPAGAHESGGIGEVPFGAPEFLVPSLMRAAAGKIPELVVHGNDYPTRDGTCVRDYPHVIDIAHAHLLALEFLINNKLESNPEIFNLGTGEGQTVKEMISTFEDSTAKKIPHRYGPRRPGDVMAIYADISKAKNVLGWNPSHSLKDIMLSAWNWEQTMVREGIV